MLELIVLGKVPGTHLQITYMQVLSIALTLFVVVFLLSEIKARRTTILRLLTAKQLKKLIQSRTA